jgi:hypothetical protein
MVWDVWQMMACEEVRNQYFREHINITSKSLMQLTYCLLFHLLLLPDGGQVADDVMMEGRGDTT